VELVAPTDEEGLVEAHQVADLVTGTAPILGREGEDGEPPDPDVQGPLDGVEQRLLAGGVAGRPGEPTLAGPPSVAGTPVRSTPSGGGEGSGTTS
jgi:hypothetical protein